MNHYAQAIDILSSENDWRAIAIDYAKKHPADFVRAASGNEGWVMECRSMGSKIECIKRVREIKGWSLKAAKEWADVNYGGES